MADIIKDMHHDIKGSKSYKMQKVSDKQPEAQFRKNFENLMHFDHTEISMEDFNAAMDKTVDEE